MPSTDDLAHVAEEEREDQRTDMRAVDVGVRHDDDLVVAQLGDVEVAGSDARAEGRDHQADLLGGEHLVEASPLHVEDLALERQNGLITAVASLLGRTARRITLDEVDLAEAGVALLAVGELAGEGGGIERALAAGQVARFARRLASPGGLDDLVDNAAYLAGMFLEEFAQALAH